MGGMVGVSGGTLPRKVKVMRCCRKLTFETGVVALDLPPKVKLGNSLIDCRLVVKRNSG